MPTAPDGSTNAYLYDALNRLTTLTNSLTGQFGFGYDALSRRTSLTRPNGVNTTYAYDPASDLLSVLHKLGAATLDGATYTYDSANTRKTRTDKRLNTTLTYGYDNIYELLSAKQGSTTKETYTYDLVGNRLTSLGVSPYSYNPSNELTATPSGSYTYDNNGNTLTDPSGKSYTWDFENRLTQVTVPVTGAVTFKYDPFDRRIYKSSSSATSVYAYDGDNLIEETNATGGVVARYSQGLNVDKPYAMLRSGATSYYEVDGLGSTTSLSNAAGALAQTYTFDSFGKPTASTGSLTNPFQYTAREFDPETNLYFYRARYYDPAIGRFISEDPVGFFGGMNFYAYVNGNPINYRDPSGQWPIHGKWCGPNWTGGHWEQYDPNHDKNGYYKDPVDPTDAVCKDHDICYYRCRTVYPCDVKTRGRCMREICDARLMLNTPTSGFWGPIISSGIDFFNDHPDAGDNAENCPNCTPKRRGGGKK